MWTSLRRPLSREALADPGSERSHSAVPGVTDAIVERGEEKWRCSSRWDDPATGLCIA